MSGREGNWPNEGPYVKAELQNLRFAVEHLAVKVAAQHQTLNAFNEKVEKLMAAIDDLKAAYEANKAEVQTDVAALQAKVADLSAQLANVPNVDPAIVALTAEITADTAAIHSSLNPTPPEPSA